jgi:hypothetical protein
MPAFYSWRNNHVLFAMPAKTALDVRRERSMELIRLSR